jgi:DNA-binding CsgD family transcriptional regulator
LIPCRNVAYFEWDKPHGALLTYNQGGDLELPPSVVEAWFAFGPQTPTNVGRLSAADGAVRLSGMISRKELIRLDFYREAMRPIGVEDELKLRLHSMPPRVAGLSFLSDRKFTERDRLLLNLLAPHLSRTQRSGRTGFGLTKREWQVLRLVARGKTNREIAGLLSLSPGTIRKHLENVFRKLGVHTRTAAVASAFPPSQN